MKKKVSNINIIQLLKEPFYPWEKFHEKTKRKKNEHFLAYEKWPKEWTTRYFKEYPRLDTIILPQAREFLSPLLKDVLLERQSSRDFSKEILSLEQLSTLLYYSAGLRNNKPPMQSNRMYPSGGARYPLEVYIISLNTEMPTGIYHYNLQQHSLEVLLEMENFACDTYFDQQWIKSAGCIVLFTTIFNRNTMKYATRGYRHILQEAGHLGQNFYLNATALHLAICAIGGYIDDEINNLLDIDGVKETVIYAIAIGNK